MARRRYKHWYQNLSNKRKSAIKAITKIAAVSVPYFGNSIHSLFDDDLDDQLADLAQLVNKRFDLLISQVESRASNDAEVEAVIARYLQVNHTALQADLTLIDQYVLRLQDSIDDSYNSFATIETSISNINQQFDSLFEDISQAIINAQRKEILNTYFEFIKSEEERNAVEIKLFDATSVELENLVNEADQLKEYLRNRIYNKGNMASHYPRNAIEQMFVTLSFYSNTYYYAEPLTKGLFHTLDERQDVFSFLDGYQAISPQRLYQILEDVIDNTIDYVTKLYILNCYDRWKQLRGLDRTEPEGWLRFIYIIQERLPFDYPVSKYQLPDTQYSYFEQKTNNTTRYARNQLNIKLMHELESYGVLIKLRLSPLLAQVISTILNFYLLFTCLLHAYPYVTRCKYLDTVFVRNMARYMARRGFDPTNSYLPSALLLFIFVIIPIKLIEEAKSDKSFIDRFVLESYYALCIFILYWIPDFPKNITHNFLGLLLLFAINVYLIDNRLTGISEPVYTQSSLFSDAIFTLNAIVILVYWGQDIHVSIITVQVLIIMTSLFLIGAESYYSIYYDREDNQNISLASKIIKEFKG